MFYLFLLLWFIIYGSDCVNASDDPIHYIIGGFPAVNGSYPYFALALRPDGHFICGGTLVSNEFILTAAHCAIGPFSLVRFFIGALCLSRSDNCGQYSEYKDVKLIFVHPNYNSTTNANDFAVVQLTSRSPIPPVRLDQGYASTNYTLGKRNLFTAGFGRISTTNAGLYANRLMEVELAYVPQDICDADYGSGRILPSMMCAYDSGKDSCNGDSGGPLFDAENNIQVGVVSWGYSCAGSYPGVYARIANQWSWIRDTICDNHSSPKPEFCPSPSPSLQPTMEPSMRTSTYPTTKPFNLTSSQPSNVPSSQQSNIPSSQPSHRPSSQGLSKYKKKKVKEQTKEKHMVF